LFSLVIALVALAPAKAAETEVDVKIGMYQTMFRDVTPQMVAAIAKPLKGIIEKTVGITGDAELVPDSATLAQKLSEKKVQIGVFHGYEFAWLKENHPNLEPLMVAIPNCGKLEAVVVVNSSNKADKVTDLKGQSVAVPKAIKAHCLLFLEDLKRGQASDVARLSEKGQSVQQILDDVSAGNTDAALLDAGSYSAYVKNSPGNASVLKTIAKSESFPFAVLAVHKDGMNASLREKITNGLGSAHTTAYGQPLMMLWGLKNFGEVPPDYNDQLATIIKLYPAPTSRVVENKLTGRDKKD